MFIATMPIKCALCTLLPVALLSTAGYTYLTSQISTFWDEDDDSVPSIRANREAQDAEADDNAAFVKQWKETFTGKCGQYNHTGPSDMHMDENSEMWEHLVGAFSPSSSAGADGSDKQRRHFQPRPVQRCRNVILDLGSRLGETVGKIVDAGLVGCGGDDRIPTFDILNLKLTSRLTRDWRAKNYTDDVEDFFRERFRNANLGPEDYCVYGFEGDPAYRKWLRRLENHILGMGPGIGSGRPLRHLHFFTESLTADQSGTEKINLRARGGDLVGSKEDGNRAAILGLTSAGSVESRTASLMKQLVASFSHSVASEENSGGHLIIKVDIESAEIQLLNDNDVSGIVCEYIRFGNTVDVFVYRQAPRSSKKTEILEVNDGVPKEWEKCGVNIYNKMEKDRTTK